MFLLRLNWTARREKQPFDMVNTYLSPLFQFYLAQYFQINRTNYSRLQTHFELWQIGSSPLAHTISEQFVLQLHDTK